MALEDAVPSKASMRKRSGVKTYRRVMSIGLVSLDALNMLDMGPPCAVVDSLVGLGWGRYRCRYYL